MMSEFSLSSFIGEIIMQVNNKMGDFIRQNVCEANPRLIQYDFNIDKIADAINKQIPKKPKDNHHCPNCEWSQPIPLLDDEWCSECFYPEYCKHCGQHLDWSEEKEQYEKRKNKK